MNAAPTASSGAAPEAPAPESHENYFEQLFTIPPVIFGRTLKPLSIGRYRMMRRFNVGFVSDNRVTATPRDLLMGVLICSTGTQEFIDMVSSPKFPKQLEKWSRKCGFMEPAIFNVPILGAIVRFLVGPAKNHKDMVTVEDEIRNFEQYIQDHSKAPNYWDETENPCVSGAHWSQSIEVVLRGELHWSGEEIEETSLNKAIWDYYKHMENKGHLRLITAAEAAELERAPTEQELESENVFLQMLAQNKNN